MWLHGCWVATDLPDLQTFRQSEVGLSQAGLPEVREKEPRRGSRGALGVSPSQASPVRKNRKQ